MSGDIDQARRVFDALAGGLAHYLGPRASMAPIPVTVESTWGSP